MTVRDFDQLSRGKVDYTIHKDGTVIDGFTRDLLQDTEVYRRNLVKYYMYEDAEIFDIYSFGDIIRIQANAKTDR